MWEWRVVGWLAELGLFRATQSSCSLAPGSQSRTLSKCGVCPSWLMAILKPFWLVVIVTSCRSEFQRLTMQAKFQPGKFAATGDVVGVASVFPARKPGWWSAASRRPGYPQGPSAFSLPLLFSQRSAAGARRNASCAVSLPAAFRLPVVLF